MRGEKKFQVGLSWYFHAISFVAGLISITLEYGTESSRRCGPLSNIRMLPFSSSVGPCCPATMGGPSFQMISPVLREMRTTASATLSFHKSHQLIRHAYA